MTEHIEKSKVKVLTDNEAQKLFQKFAAPLFRGANSVTRKKSAHELAKTIWVDLVTGHENEEMIFEELRRSLADPERLSEKSIIEGISTRSKISIWQHITIN